MRTAHRHAVPCLLVCGAFLSTLIGCGSNAVGPTHGDVDIARAEWLAGGYTDYRFQLATESSWFPRSDWQRIDVENDEVVRVSGEPVTPEQQIPPTIEEIWAWILEARASGQLNHAEFDRRGVPVHADMGPWPVDGGVAYWIRSFIPAD
jgi:hypothetical protein